MGNTRVALVTGAARGLGREIAVALAGRSAAVAVHFLRQEKEAERTAGLVREAGVPARTFRADLTREGETRSLVRRVETAFGRLDILVNNVGPIRFKPWDALCFADWEVLLRGNLLGAYACLRAALPGMRRRRWGRVVNIGFGRVGQLAAFPTVLPYAVAKTGLLILTRTAAAAEKASGVTVNMVSPGLLTGGLLPAGTRVRRADLGTFADVAAAVRFLVSDEAKRISGTDLLVAGTWKM
jgi:3-oxoacyl-[acyl-carrier protein] reductase